MTSRPASSSSRGREEVRRSKSLLGKASLTVQLTGADGETRTVASDITKDRIGETVDLNLASVPPGQATLRLTLKVTTANATNPDGSTEPGTELAPQSVDIPLSVAPPIGFPTVASKLDFGTVEGGGVFKGSLGPVGSEIDGTSGTDEAAEHRLPGPAIDALTDEATQRGGAALDLCEPLSPVRSSQSMSKCLVTSVIVKSNFKRQAEFWFAKRPDFQNASLTSTVAIHWTGTTHSR